MKKDKKERVWLNEYELVSQLAKDDQIDYRSLPSKTSQQIIKVLFKNWKSFWKLIKTKGLKGKPQIPKFKDKLKGRNIIIFTNQGCKIKDGFIYFNKKCGIIKVKTNIKNDQLNQVRIIPQSNCYVLEVVYVKEKEEKELDISKYLSIDLGINNLAACITNQDLNPLLVNGKIVKSINQYYNKTKAKFMSFIGDKGISNRIRKLNFKRNNKINDYFHKTSRFIINYCLKNKIQTIIIGYNEGWKQNCNIGKVNNQKFVSIPYLKLIKQIEYKAEEVGIFVLINEERFTSKCDALALEELKHHDKYLGTRVHRGLYQSSVGKMINADVNGAINIMRKVVDNLIVKSIINRGCVNQPIRINF
jgi:putative transposase